MAHPFLVDCLEPCNAFNQNRSLENDKKLFLMTDLVLFYIDFITRNVG